MAEIPVGRHDSVFLPLARAVGWRVLSHMPGADIFAIYNLSLSNIMIVRLHAAG